MLAAFLDGVNYAASGNNFPPRHDSLPVLRTLLQDLTRRLDILYQRYAQLILPCPRVTYSGLRWYRNVNLLSIAYGSRPRLRPRLTLSGRTFLRKPRIFGGQDSHLPCATHANIFSRMKSTVAYAPASARIRCSPTTLFVSAASVSGFSPVHLRRRATRLVSYYALFE